MKIKGNCLINSLLIVLCVGIFHIGCVTKQCNKPLPPLPAEFTDSVYRLYPLFCEMIDKNIMTKKYYSSSDTITLTFKKGALERYNGTMDSELCWYTSGVSISISYYFDNGKKLGDVCLGSETSRHGNYIFQNSYRGITYKDTTINSKTFSNNYRIGTTYPCDGDQVEMIYDNALLLANTSSGLYLINLKSLNKVYHAL